MLKVGDFVKLVSTGPYQLAGKFKVIALSKSGSLDIQFCDELGHATGEIVKGQYDSSGNCIDSPKLRLQKVES